MKFEDILGQKEIIDKIEGMLRTDNLPSVLLFYGPEGTGKKSTALRIAKALNCMDNNPPESFFCGECPSCQKIEKQIHPDIHILSPDGDSIKIEDVREMMRNISQVPFEGKRKIAILDNAEALTIQAANALLKTLEEPPEKTHIFLISSNPGKLPLTLKSRCYPLRFLPLSEETIIEILRRDNNFHSMDGIRIVAGLAEGGIENARALLEADILNERQNFLQILDAGDYNIKSYVLFAGEKAESIDVRKRYLHLFKRIILDILFYKMSLYERIKNRDIMEEIKRIAIRMNKLHLWSILKEMERFESVIEMNINFKLHQNLLLLDILNTGFSLKE